MSKEDIDESFLEKAKYLFISGITPALSSSCREMVFEAIKIAKKNHLKIIFDPNIRRKLWGEEEARNVLLEICAHSDIILPGQSEGEFLFGESDTSILGEKFLQLGAEIVVIKLGEQGAAYFTKDNHEFVPGFHVKHLVDPVGAGDGFAAGFVSGLIDGLNLRNSVTRANAVGALVTMVSGDVEGLPEKEDIDKFIHQVMEDVNR